MLDAGRSVSLAGKLRPTDQTDVLRTDVLANSDVQCA